HPFFDELPRQELQLEFISAQRTRPGTIIGLLPGSRTQEVERNLSTLVRAASRIHAARPDTRFLVACYQEHHRDHVIARLRHRGLPVAVFAGRTPEIIHRAHSCVAVSGSVSLELLYYGKPTVVIYRIRPLDLRVSRLFITSKYISLVNLLAGKELFPEYLTDRCQAEAVSAHVLGWLSDPAAYAAVRQELAALRDRVAAPGACESAAQYLLDVLKQKPEMRRRAAA
ncbi:MAG TPA: lipid-A-disaccharide synthetase, partial [Gemmataceae bacterium]|nr:lipid-A-disaccharide synthetase [Gemmataceae bacterium]